MRKPNPFTIGWMTGITYTTLTWIADEFIHDFFVYLLVCIAVAVPLYLLGDWIASRS